MAKIKKKLMNSSEVYQFLINNPSSKIKRITDGHILINANGYLFCQTCFSNKFVIQLAEDKIYEEV